MTVLLPNGTYLESATGSGRVFLRVAGTAKPRRLVTGDDCVRGAILPLMRRVIALEAQVDRDRASVAAAVRDLAERLGS